MISILLLMLEIIFFIMLSSLIFIKHAYNFNYIYFCLCQCWALTFHSVCAGQKTMLFGNRFFLPAVWVLGMNPSC